MDIVYCYNNGKRVARWVFFYLPLFEKAILGPISNKLNVKATELNILLEGYSQRFYWRLDGCEGLMGRAGCGGAIGQSLQESNGQGNTGDSSQILMEYFTIENRLISVA